MSEFSIFGEDRRVELQGLRHVALNFHLTTHKCSLALDFTGDQVHKVSVEHHEGAVWGAFRFEGDLTVAVLQVNSDDRWLVVFVGADFEVINTANLLYDSRALLFK